MVKASGSNEKRSVISFFIRVYACPSVVKLYLTDAAFQAHTQKFLRFDSEFHRQFLEHFLAEAIHDHVDRVLRGDAARIAIENLVFTDL